MLNPKESGQLPDFGKPEVVRQPPHLSFSKITEYLICPGCYSRRKERRVKSPETRETVFGQTLHLLAGIVFRSAQRKTEMRYRKIEQLATYVRERFLRDLRGEYPSWVSPERPYFPLCLPDPKLASSIEKFEIFKNDAFWDFLAYYLEVCRSRRQRLLARELHFSFLLKGEGESGVIIDGIIDQVRQNVEGTLKLKSGETKRRFGKILETWELKTHIPLREETQTPYGTLATQMVLEGMGYREILKTRQKEKPLPDLQLVAFEFSSGDYWILKTYDEEGLKKAILAVHRAMGLYKEYNPNHPHTFGPQEATQPRLIEDETPSYRAYEKASALFKDFRNSCLWQRVETGARARDDLALLAQSV